MWRTAKATAQKGGRAYRVLVFRFGQLGDTLVALPAFHGIRASFPNAYIVLLEASNSSQRWINSQEILPAGLIDEVLAYEPQAARTPVGQLRLLITLRAYRFDSLVYLVPRTRSRQQVIRDLLFFRLAGIRHFFGHHGIDRLPGRDSSGRLPDVEHEAQHLLQRLQQSGIGLTVSVDSGYDLGLSAGEHRAVEEFLRAEGLSNPSEALLVGFGPGSKWPSKRWPVERFRDVGQKLIAEYGVLPVIFGGTDERDLGEALIRHWRCGINAAGKLTVREAAALLKRCAVYVGNDTGTMHLAAAVGTRCVAIFSAQDWPGRWYPLGRGHVVLRRAPPCEGCGLAICLQHDNACLRAIEVPEVARACAAVLEARDSTKVVVAKSGTA